MTNIQKILSGIITALEEDGPAALRIEIETALLAVAAVSDYRQEDIALAVFGCRTPTKPEEAEADA